MLFTNIDPRALFLMQVEVSMQGHGQGSKKPDTLVRTALNSWISQLQQPSKAAMKVPRFTSIEN